MQLARRFLAIAAAIGFVTAMAAPAAAQQPEQGQQQANLDDFDFVVQKITTNYAGYDTKVTDANRAALESLTIRLRARAAAASDEQLLDLLGEWLGFFQDGHIGIQPGASASDSAPSRPHSTPILDWTEESVRLRLRELGRRRDPVEGIWDIDGGLYRLGVLRTAPSTFSAVVLTTTSSTWEPGQVKAELRRTDDGHLNVIYRMGDHSERSLEGRLVLDGVLDLGDQIGAWTREDPPARDPHAALRRYPGGALFLRSLSADTLWLRIPDFSDARAHPLRELLEQHAAALASTPNLIIDLRNNSGGSDYVYDPLLPLIYTRPIYSIGVEMRATQDNIALREAVASSLEAQAPEQAALLRAQNALMAQNLGEYVLPNPRRFDIYTHDEVRPYPRRVAVMIDGAGSTGEQFLLAARQSRKVTLFGQRNSHGVLDFANIVRMPTPSGRHTLFWATSRSLRLPEDPVDPDGIAPDIRIPAEEADPLVLVQRWLEHQTD